MYTYIYLYIQSDAKTQPKPQRRRRRRRPRGRQAPRLVFLGCVFASLYMYNICIYTPRLCLGRAMAMPNNNKTLLLK